MDPLSKGQAWLGRVVRLAYDDGIRPFGRRGGEREVVMGRLGSAGGGEGRCACAVCESSTSRYSTYSLYCTDTRTLGGRRWTAGRWRAVSIEPNEQATAELEDGNGPWAGGCQVTGESVTGGTDEQSRRRGGSRSWAEMAGALCPWRTGQPTRSPSLKLSLSAVLCTSTRKPERRGSDEVS